MLKIFKNGHILCPFCEGGSIQSYQFFDDNAVIYVCEECEETWLSLNDAFDLRSSTDFMSYLKKRGLIKDGVKTDWASIGKNLDYITFEDVEEIVKEKGVEVVLLEK